MEHNVVYLWQHDIAIIHIASNIKAPIMAENKIIGNNAPASSLPPVDRSESRPILWPIYNATAHPTHSRKAYLNTSAGAGAGYAVSDSRSSARSIIDGCCRSFVLLQGQRMQRYSAYLS